MGRINKFEDYLDEEMNKTLKLSWDETVSAINEIKNDGE